MLEGFCSLGGLACQVWVGWIPPGGEVGFVVGRVDGAGRRWGRWGGGEEVGKSFPGNSGGNPKGEGGLVLFFLSIKE